MCGINGVIAGKAVNHDAIEKMNQALLHRGPDGQGLWASANQKIILGHTRLAILDLDKHADQPMQRENNQHILTFNGEIYNFLEIKQTLIQLGFQFDTHSDTEVILHAYTAWGVDCINYFNGMFAFCLIDLQKNIAFIARDRYGEKPLLFYHGNNFLAFSSEYKALFTLKEIPVEYRQNEFLSFLNSPSHKLDNHRDTVFIGVQQLLPAERMIVNLKTLEKKIDRYWNITDFSRHKISEQDAIAEFKSLLIDSVALRMRSDVKVGSCLSGGLDSTAIVSIVRELQGKDFPYHTFTGRFPGTSADEWFYAEKTIKSKQVIAHTTEPTAAEFIKILPQFMLANELPVGSASQFAQWKIFELAKQTGVTVLLDGQGADEILGGYEQYFRFYLKDIFSIQHYLFYYTELKRINRRYPLALFKKQQQLIQLLPKKMQYYLSQHLNRGSNFLFGLTEDRIDHVNELNLDKLQGESNIKSHLKSALYHDSFSNNLTTLLRYGDRNSMAHSREVRLPFCDYRIAEFIFTLPETYLMGGAQTKRILRKSMSGLLPTVIQRRWNKQGFLPPQVLWFQQELGTFAEQIFHQSDFLQRGFWNVSWWHKALERFKQGDYSLSSTLWKGMIGECWLEYFVKPMQNGAKISVWKND